MEVADDGHTRRHPACGLVQRRQVMEVQHVGLSGARALQLPGPGPDLALVIEVIEAGEDGVRRARPLLEGGMDRRGPGRAFVAERCLGGERRGEIDGLDVVAVERAGVAVRSRSPREPASSVTDQPSSRSPRACARAAWADPPRGEKRMAETTSSAMVTR